MSRRPANFTKSDLLKVMRAARECGLKIVRTELGHDRAVFVHTDGGEPMPVVNELDAWRTRRNARAA
jgi:SH3-like domain-containing protein